MTHARHLLSLLIALQTLPLSGQETAAPPEAETRSVRDRLDGQLRSFHETHPYPALSAAVAREGEVFWSGVVGSVNVSTKTPAERSTRFRIGSTSKALTATAAAMLAERDVLDWDQPIAALLPDLPEALHTITPRQLASHQAGIRHYQGNEYLNRTHYDTVAAAVHVFAKDPLLFEPGTAYGYSTYGYTLLSRVMEVAAEKPFLELMQELLFDPLELANTGPELRDDGRTDRPIYYGPSRFNGQTMPMLPIDHSNKWAGGGFESTATDLATFGAALLDGRLVKLETAEMLLTPQPLADGSETGENYGLGFRRHRRPLPTSGREEVLVHHGGTALGGRAFLVLLPEHDLVVALLGNYHDSEEPFWDFAEIALALADAVLASETD